MNYKVVLYGVPVRSSRGFMGWCTISLISKNGKTILFDTGSYGDRNILLDNLAKIGINPRDVNIVFLSHLHYDHSINVELFKRARVYISLKELDYFLSDEYISVGDNLIPAQIINSVKDRIQGVKDGEEIVTGIKTIDLSGHTPGTMGLLMEDVIFTGDAVKNAWEFVHGKEPSPIFGDPKKAVVNYDIVKKVAATIVPGHDAPFKITDKGVEYLNNHCVDIYSYQDPSRYSFTKIKI